MLPAIQAILAREIGLDPASIGDRTLQAAVDVRIRAGAAPATSTVAEYATRLAGSADERAALIEEVVIPETWFFRDREPFRLLGRVAPAWFPDGRTVRVLSVPCSTGEEPLSLVMALVDAGLDPSRVEVAAVDISRRALALAARGLYGRNSFRGDELSFRDRHFSKEGREWRIDARVHRTLRLLHGNALDIARVVLGARFDVILCRNLFIYLTAAAREQVVAGLESLLAPDGLLLVGHADGGAFDARGAGFELFGEPGAFAYRRSAARGDARPDPPLARPASRPPSSGRRTTTSKLRAGSVGTLPSGSSSSPPPAASPAAASPPAASSPAGASPSPLPLDRAELLRHAQRLADGGALAEAARMVEAQLPALGPDAAAYHLLGMIASAQGDSARAERLFEKAIYCDPAHGLALLNLALLAEARGDAAAAANFRRRAGRARPPEGTP